jgi:uncharacterized RDD family membrane protein YckC
MSDEISTELEERGVIAVESPEAVVLRFPLAELLARVLAFGVDLALIAVITVFLVLVGALLAGLSGLAEPIAGVLVGVFLVRQFYFVAFEVLWHGATPGKRLVNLRVIARDGRGLTVDAVVTRNLLRDLELFVPLALIAAPEQVFGGVPGWIWAPAVLWTLVISLLPILTKERTRAGDLAGGTVVVRVPRATLIADQAARTSILPAARSEGIELTAEHLSVYGEMELEILADLIRKIDDGRATLQDQAHIARTIAKKIGYDGPEPAREPTRFLTTFYKQQRAALEKRLLFGKRKSSKHDR